MLSAYDLVFYFLAIFALFSAFGVVTSASPIYSAFFLVLTMMDIACLFVMLGAFFIAGVQLVVYAGAVVVLFVMVLMLFNLHKETEAFSKGTLSGMAKLGATGLLCGILATTLFNFASRAKSMAADIGPEESTEKLAKLLFSDYVFGFEAISILILVVAVGAVALSQIKGGSHAKS